MSNPVLIVPTMFEDRDLDGTVIGTSYGLRVSDNEASTYENWAETFEGLSSLDPAAIVERARGIDDVAAAILAHAEEHDTPVTIGSRTFDWDQLRSSPPSPRG